MVATFPSLPPMTQAFVVAFVPQVTAPDAWLLGACVGDLTTYVERRDAIRRGQEWCVAACGHSNHASWMQCLAVLAGLSALNVKLASDDELFAA